MGYPHRQQGVMCVLMHAWRRLGGHAIAPHKSTGALSAPTLSARCMQGATSSLKSEDVKDGALEPDTIDTVVEGRLGGGEEVIYSPADGPPLHQSDPTPRS